ncbi:hypothetical protein K474DRAFT_1713522 [Panus rudis PR-1116 ss-1]|nr:hypothetical protein K474DRAFT_1713522 [Panus rudis PR-1116 ss-1]
MASTSAEQPPVNAPTTQSTTGIATDASQYPQDPTARLVRMYFGRSGKYSEEQLKEYSEDKWFLQEAGMAAPSFIRKKISGPPRAYTVRVLAGAECIFPLADNGTDETMDVAILVETLEALREDLGPLQGTVPRWYRVTVF